MRLFIYVVFKIEYCVLIVVVGIRDILESIMINFFFYGIYILFNVVYNNIKSVFLVCY